MFAELEAAAADWFRSVVGKHGEKHSHVGEPCANCETVLQGAYCHACGQVAHDHKRSILHLFWEALESLFHFDGRLWRTMPLLFFKPGKLADDYIHGRMARHVPPFRTFLVSLLLFIFAAEGAIHKLRHEAELKQTVQNARLATVEGRLAEAARLRGEAIAQKGKDLKEAAADHAKSLKEASDDSDRREAETELKASVRSAERSYEKQIARAAQIEQGKTFENGFVLGADASKRRELAGQIRSDTELDGSKTVTAGHASTKATGWFKEGLARAVENPDYYMTVMFGWAHRLAILLLPIVGLSLATVYFYKRKFYLYDHLLVAMNLLSFTFLTNALGLVLPMAAWPYWFGFLAIWTPINLFQTLRGGYHSSIIGALLKTLFVWWVTVVAFASLLITLMLFTLSQI